jgi:hypothetical protein
MTTRLCHDFATSGSRIGHRGALSSTVHARDGGPGTPRNLRPVLTERRIWRGGIGGAPGRSRTCDPRIRSPMLYPAELQARAVILAGERAPVNFRYPRRALNRAR